MFGLSLVLTDVDESGPAWSSGVRPGTYSHINLSLIFKSTSAAIAAATYKKLYKSQI